ncbi:MAG: DUF5317 domain-containing protein [Actinomycetota bacterium]
MLIAFVLALAAGGAAVLRGGSLDALGRTRMRWPWLAFAGLAVQSVLVLWSPAWLHDKRALFITVIANLALLIFIAGNRRLPGMLIADIGIALNLLVIVANGAMPVSPDAARSAGIERSPEGLEHEVIGDGTLLPWLGDVIPLPHLREVWSFGDLFLAVGIARLVYARTLSETEATIRTSPVSG